MERNRLTDNTTGGPPVQVNRGGPLVQVSRVGPVTNTGEVDAPEPLLMPVMNFGQPAPAAPEPALTDNGTPTPLLMPTMQFERRDVGRQTADAGRPTVGGPSASPVTGNATVAATGADNGEETPLTMPRMEFSRR